MFLKHVIYLYLLGLLSLTHQVLAQADTVYACEGESIPLQADAGYDRYRWYPGDNLQSINGVRVFYQGTTNATVYVQQQNFIGENLVVNPDFEDGNVGFTSGYRHTPGGNNAQGTYSVVADANLHNPSFSACTDAANPGNLIMAIDGSSDASMPIWCQTFTVNPNTGYAFRLDLASLSNSNPSRLRVRINGEDVGVVLTGDVQSCFWKRSLAYWESLDLTRAEVCIYNLNTSASGNDFAIDDLSFTELGPIVLDSIYVSLGQRSFGEQEVKLCGNERFTEYGLDLAIGESDVATLQNQAGCDSLLTVTAVPGDSLILTQIVDTLCIGDTLRFDNWVITTDTLLCKTLPAQAGCDTILCIETRYFTAENIETVIDPPSCTGDVDGEIALTNLAGTGTIQYAWTDGPTGARRTGLGPGTFDYTATDQKGCSISASIVLEDPLPLVIEDILTVGVRCANEQNGFAIIDVSGGTGPVDFFIERNGTLFNIDTLSIGTYNLTVQDSLGCAVTDVFTIDGPGPVSVSLTGDTLVRLGELATHQVSFRGDNADFSLTYNEEPVDTLLNMGSLTWSPPGEGLLVATVIDENGCEAMQSIFVKLQSRDMEFFPNAFSPNEDGVNDRFGPARDPAIIGFEEYIIADRWGNIIYRVKDCPIDAAGTCFWDGRRDDKLLDTGVYVYYASLLLIDGTTIQRSGEVTLVTTRD